MFTICNVRKRGNKINLIVDLKELFIFLIDFQAIVCESKVDILKKELPQIKAEQMTKYSVSLQFCYLQFTFDDFWSAMSFCCFHMFPHFCTFVLSVQPYHNLNLGSSFWTSIHITRFVAFLHWTHHCHLGMQLLTNDYLSLLSSWRSEVSPKWYRKPRNSANLII